MAEGTIPSNIFSSNIFFFLMISLHTMLGSLYSCHRILSFLFRLEAQLCLFYYGSSEKSHVSEPLACFPAVVHHFSWHFLSLIISGTACLLFHVATRNSPLSSWSLKQGCCWSWHVTSLLQVGRGSFWQVLVAKEWVRWCCKIVLGSNPKQCYPSPHKKPSKSIFLCSKKCTGEATIIQL